MSKGIGVRRYFYVVVDMPRDIEKRIVEVLKNHPEGLTIKQIAQKVGLHRLNITKYIYALTASGIIYQRKVGPAKLCYLKKVME